MTSEHIKSDEMAEKFNPFVFVVGLLVSALFLLAVPIGILFHPTALWYFGELGTAVFFVAIYMMTAHRLMG